jgi:hypothetical protein
MNKLIFTLQLGFLLISFNAFSQQSTSPIIAKFVIEGGIEYGGDEILKVTFTNGEDQTMRAGQGGYIAVGGQFEFSEVEKLMIRTTIGFKYNTTAADDANIRLTRIPLTLIPYWKINEDFRFGVGITSHQSVKFKGDGFAPDVDFKSSLGPRVEFGYKWIALTYTAVNYKTPAEESFSASSVGLSVSFAFPNK